VKPAKPWAEVDQFRRTVIEDRRSDPAEFDIQWLMAQQTAAESKPSNVLARVEIRHVGPATVSDEKIKSKIGATTGAPTTRTQVVSDVRNL
jgi:hypothetical protein